MKLKHREDETSSMVDFVIAKPFQLSALISAYAGAAA